MNKLKQKLVELEKEYEELIVKESQSRSFSDRLFYKKLDKAKEISKLKGEIRSQEYLRKVNERPKYSESKKKSEYQKAVMLHKKMQASMDIWADRDSIK
ncbi:hypothetical protein [Staphylococcus phage vB_StaM_SA1]|nr:hypothetical protein [Staphylococcus phage vB_StaM_SA1]